MTIEISMKIISDLHTDNTFLLSLRSACSAINNDEPEDVLGGLDTSIKLNWSEDHGNHILVHLADAPAHGKGELR